jgi:hypothetical protein
MILSVTDVTGNASVIAFIFDIVATKIFNVSIK